MAALTTQSMGCMLMLYMSMFTQRARTYTRMHTHTHTHAQNKHTCTDEADVLIVRAVIDAPSWKGAVNDRSLIPIACQIVNPDGTIVVIPATWKIKEVECSTGLQGVGESQHTADNVTVSKIKPVITDSAIDASVLDHHQPPLPCTGAIPPFQVHFQRFVSRPWICR